MKNHRFPWLRNRTTDNRKCEKARNIKEKRTIEMFNTVSKQLVALRSSASDNLQLNNAKKARKYAIFRAFSMLLEPGGIDHSESSRNNQSELIRNSQCTCLAN